MNLDAALAELGLARGVTQDEIKKAYLRLVKTRKPESDPEGFMRLREAYEIAKNARPMDLAPRDASTASEPVALRRNAPRERAPRTPRSDVVSESGDEPALPSASVPVVRAQIIPISAFEDPWPANRDALEPWIARLGVAETTERVCSALDGATASVGPLPFATEFALHLALALFAAGHARHATRVVDRFDAWLKSTGDELRITRGPNAVIWSATRELRKIALDIAPPITTALAQGTTTASPSGVIEALGEYAQDHEQAIVRAAGILELEAPTLHGLFGRSLNALRRAPEPSTSGPTPHAQKGNARWTVWLGLVMVSALVRTLAPGENHRSETPSEVTRAYETPDRVPERVESPVLPRSSRSTYMDALDRIATAAESRHQASVAQFAMQLQMALGLHDCENARRKREELERAATGFDVWFFQGMTSQVRIVDDAINAQCGTAEDGGHRDGAGR